MEKSLKPADLSEIQKPVAQNDEQTIEYPKLLDQLPEGFYVDNDGGIFHNPSMSYLLYGKSWGNIHMGDVMMEGHYEGDVSELPGILGEPKKIIDEYVTARWPVNESPGERIAALEAEIEELREINQDLELLAGAIRDATVWDRIKAILIDAPIYVANVK